MFGLMVSNFCLKMSFIKYMLCILLVSNVAEVFSKLKTVDRSKFDKFIKENRFVLAHIKNTENCGETCKTNQKILEEMQKESLFHGVSFISTYHPTLLKPYSKETDNILVFYRNGNPIYFEGHEFFEQEVLDFYTQHNNIIYTKELNDLSFEHQTQATSGSTTGDWFILFYNSACSEYLSLWEALAARFHQRKVLAVIDTQTSPITSDRFGPTTCPSAFFLRAGKYYRYEQPMSIKNLQLFAEGWYTNVPSKVIKPLPTAFDQVLNTIVGLMKENEYIKYSIIAVFLIVVFLLFICLFTNNYPKERVKTT